ncbi:MAG TPA: DUF4157 domain-containing protein [Pyrinomonadaceae bacterium]|nr:DUF4157 domain-containing protein [Pyrinomonadaceae bacterium]
MRKPGGKFQTAEQSGGAPAARAPLARAEGLVQRAPQASQQAADAGAGFAEVRTNSADAARGVADAALSPEGVARLGHDFRATRVRRGDPPRLQAKLVVGRPDDPYEQEADRVAAEVVNMPDAPGPSTESPGSRTHTAAAPPTVQRACAACESREDDDEEHAVQAKSLNGATPALTEEFNAGLRAERGGGRPLPESARSYFEPRFGHDFSRVRIHTGEAADRLARTVEARAFTTGSDIFFGARQYDASGRAGRELLAHELTHVVQQSPAGAVGAGAPTLSRRPADTIARQPAPAAEQTPAAPEPPRQGKPTGKVNLIRITSTQVFFETTEGTFTYALDFNHTPAGDYTADVRMGTQNKDGVTVETASLLLRGKIETKAQLHVNAEGMIVFFHFNYTLKPGQIDPVIFLKNTGVVRVSVTGTKEPGAPGGVEGGAGGGEVKAQGEGPKTEGADGDKPGGGKAEGEQQGGGQQPAGGEKEGGQPGFGGGLEGDKGLTANAPALPSKLEGPEEQTTNGIGTYTMSLDYSAASADRLVQVALAMGGVDYHWELYDITNAAKKSGQEAGAELKRLKRKGQLGKDTEEARTVGRTEAATRRFELTAEEILEDRKTAEEDLQEAMRDKDITRAIISLGNLDPRVAAISGVIRLTGDALGFVADALGGDYQERSVTWRKKGIYVLRCVARPHPRYNDRTGESLIRPPSVSVITVAVKPLREIAADEVKNIQTQDEELKLLRGLLEKEQDPEQRKKLEAQIAEYERATRGAAPDVLQDALDRKRKQLAEEERRGNIYAARRLRGEITSLEQQLEMAKTRVETKAGQSVLRPRATFISRITGQKYSLLLQLQLTEPEGPGGKYKARVADVTTPDGVITDAVEGATPGAAAWGAMRAFTRKNEYGRGALAVVMPEGITPAPTPTTDLLDNKPHDEQIAKRHLEDIVTALSVVAAVAVPELGAVAAVAGAGLAAANLAERYKNGTLRLDARAVGDLVAVLSAAAIGVGAVGGLAFARSGNRFVLALAEGDQAAALAAVRGMNRAATVVRGASVAGQVIDYGGMVIGTATTLDQLLAINAKEAAGEITHADARYQRTQLIAGAIRDNTLMFVGAKTSARAAAAVEGRTPAPGEHPPAVGTKPPQEPAAGATEGGPAAPKSKPTPEAVDSLKSPGAPKEPPAAGAEKPAPAAGPQDKAADAAEGATTPPPARATPTAETPQETIKKERPAGEPAAPAEAAPEAKPGSTADPLAKPADPKVAADMERLRPVDEETRKRLEGNEALRTALVENELAAAALKKCQSPCFPPEATPAQVERLNNILKRLKSGGVAYDQDLLKQFLADNRDNLDAAINSLLGWSSTSDLNAVLRYFAEGGSVEHLPPSLDPRLFQAMRQRAHDAGVAGGRAKAASDGLKSFGWDNPIKTGGFGQGFDDIMVKGADLDTGIVYIVEYKGGLAKLAPGQMELEWIKGNIRRLATEPGPHGHDIAVKLAKALKEGRLKGVVYSTPLDAGKPGATVQVGGVRDYGKVGMKLPAPPGAELHTGGVSEAKGPLDPTPINPKGLATNCGFCSLAGALTRVTGRPLVFDADQLYIRTLERLRLPTNTPEDPVNRQLIFPERTGYDKIAEKAGYEALFSGKEGNRLSEYTILAAAGDAGLVVSLDTEVLNQWAKYFSGSLEQVSQTRWDELVREAGGDPDDVRTTYETLRGGIERTRGRLPGEFIIGSKSRKHFMNMTIGPDGRLTGYDYQSGTEYEGLAAIEGRMGKIDFILRVHGVAPGEGSQ